MNDTPPEIAELVRHELMARSGAERVLMGSRMFDAARAIMLASFPPGLSETEIRIRLCDRLYGNEIDVDSFAAHLRSSHPERNAGHDAPDPDEATAQETS